MPQIFWLKIIRVCLIVSSFFGLFVSLMVFVFLIDPEYINTEVLPLLKGRLTECSCLDTPSNSTKSLKYTKARIIYGALLLNGFEPLKITSEVIDHIYGSLCLNMICYMLTEWSCIILSVQLLFLIKFCQVKVKRVLLSKNYVNYLSSESRRRNYILLSYAIVASSLFCFISLIMFVGFLSIVRFVIGLNNEEAFIFWSHITVKFPLIFYKSWNNVMASVCSCGVLGYILTLLIIIHIYASHIMRISFLLLLAYSQSKVVRLYLFRKTDSDIFKSKNTMGYLPSSFQCGDHFVSAAYSGKRQSFNKAGLGGLSNHNVSYEEESTAF